MSIPESLTSCMDPSSMSLKDYVSNAADLAKASGMGEKCVKAAETEASAASASVSASVLFASASAQASWQNSKTKMAEAGCGQFALNVQNQMQQMKNINCKIKSTSNSVSAEQVSGNSISFRTLPLTSDEQANKAKLEKQILDLEETTLKLLANPNVPADRLKIMLDLNQKTKETTKLLLESYKRDINITKSNIIQSIVARQASSISLKTSDVDNIVVSQKAIAQATAENKLAQDLGVAALTPESKSVISSNIEQSNIFTNQNVTNTINSVKMVQKSSNSLELVAPGNINLTKSNITQSIVADMVIKALIGNSFQAGTQIANDFLAEASSKIATDGKSAGADALAKELGIANANAIKAAKIDPMGGSIFAVILVLLLVFGFFAFKSAGSMMMNNAVFIMAIVSIVAGVVFLGKEGASNKVLGVIIIVLGVAGLGFGVMLRMRVPKAPLRFRFD